GIVACLGDHGSAVGVADEDDGSVLGVDDALGRGGVVCERQRRVLGDRDGVAALLQQAVDGLPTRAVDKTAVDEDYVAWSTHGALLREMEAINSDPRSRPGT